VEIFFLFDKYGRIIIYAVSVDELRAILRKHSVKGEQVENQYSTNFIMCLAVKYSTGEIFKGKIQRNRPTIR